MLSDQMRQEPRSERRGLPVHLVNPTWPQLNP